nr:unnamed protein product [Digitaria exilis]
MAASLAAGASARFVAGGEASPARPRPAAPARVAWRSRPPAAGVRCRGARAPAGGVLPEEADDGARFVGWFREAWPYIRGHRGSTFVVVVSGEVVAGPHFDGILQDISLLHGLGIKFVLVPGTHVQIDKLLAERDSLEAAMEAAGRIRLTIEAKLSPGPPMLNLRRHGRRGVVAGIDYGFTGEVKKIDVSRIRERLDRDSIVVVSNMGYSSAGEHVR